MNKLFSISVFFLFFSASIAAQKIDSAIHVMSRRFPAEKIYIHYDKGYYVAGETVWFKSYLYNNGLPSDLSYNFYLQLLDRKGQIIVSQKYPVKGATVSGSIELPGSLPQGAYTVRALTPAMLFAEQDYLYTGSFFVFNPSSSQPKEQVSGIDSLKTLSVRFFPEGGQLLADVLSVIAFKSTDAAGHPASISGIIKTDDTTTIASFKTFHDGMGKFQFRPKAGKKYMAEVIVNGKTNYFPLPEPVLAGINLKIENEKGGKLFQITRSKNGKDDYAQVRVVAQMNHRVVFDSEISFDNYFSVKGHLLTDSMPSGILQFTVFNKEGMPLAERLTFVDNKEYYAVGTIELIKAGTGARQENSIEINFPQEAQRSISVSVTDFAATRFAVNPNIISSLLLTSDLRGTVYNPDWYFQQHNDSVQPAMDNLMLTHGWRKFSWQKILSGQIPTPLPADKYLTTITGKLTDSKTKETVSDGILSIFMESEDSVNQNFDVPVTVTGTFTIDSLLIWGKTKLFYGYKNAQGKERTTDIAVYRSKEDTAVLQLAFAPQEESVALQEITSIAMGEAISRRYQQGNSKLSETKELAAVVIESKSNKRPIEQVNDKYTKGVFTQMGRVNFDNINQPENNRSLSVYDFVRRSIRAIAEQDGNFVNTKNFSLFKNSSDEWYAQQEKTLDSNRAIGGGGAGAPGDQRFIDKGVREKGEYFPIAVFLNESITGISFLKTIRMDEVALIKFYEPGFIGAGTGGPGGALVIYTKELKEDNKERIEKLDELQINGYTITREFFSPDYSKPEFTTPNKDNRTTLLWKPDVYTDENQKTIRLSFYNNDITSGFKIIAEGIDTNGKLIHLEKVVEK
jgi:hypothetical protein